MLEVKSKMKQDHDDECKELRSAALDAQAGNESTHVHHTGNSDDIPMPDVNVNPSGSSGSSSNGAPTPTVPAATQVPLTTPAEHCSPVPSPQTTQPDVPSTSITPTVHTPQPTPGSSSSNSIPPPLRRKRAKPSTAKLCTPQNSEGTRRTHGHGKSNRIFPLPFHS